MPRHTHIPPARKHDRAYLREQRERHINRRFRRAKRDGTFPALTLSPRYRFSGDREETARVHADIEAFLAPFGYPAPALGPPHYGSADAHPDLVRYLPRDLRRRVSGLRLGAPASLGQLADRDSFSRYRCDCARCRPEAIDGYRRRQKNRWERESARELLDRATHAEEPALSGRRSTVVEQVKRTWC